MKKVLLTGAVRSPIGDLNGSLSTVSAVAIGKTCASESLRRVGLEPNDIDESIFGNVLQAGQGQNPSRQISIGVNIPERVPAFTVNKVCASGMKAIELGWQSIILGRAQAILVGGIESMTQAPYFLPAMRGGAKLGDTVACDLTVSDGLTDIFGKVHMGITAENIAEKYYITRQQQDEFALQSHLKWTAALKKVLLSEEILPVKVTQKKKEIVLDIDEHPRPDTSLEKLSKLKPAFKKDGTVTAGNASGINDGAASMVLMAADSNLAENIDRTKTVLIRDFAVSGCDPALMGLGPIDSVRKLLEKTGIAITDIDLWELNEAFASQSIAVLKELEIDLEKVNVNGGAIALGHPIGASGARIVVTLVHQMKRQQFALGIAAMCVGGGMGMAVLLENI